MSELMEIIKTAALQAVRAEKPAELAYGQITGVSPLRIKLEQGQEIDEDFLIGTEAVSRRWEVGERAVLLRKQGGQEYLLIDRLVT